MDQTPNYALGKPLGGENYDVEVQNDNMDTIDLALAGLDGRMDDVEAANLVHFPGSYRVRLTAAGAQSLAHNAPEVLELGTSVTTFDTSAGAMLSKSTDEIKIIRAGWYICSMRVAFAPNANGHRAHLIRKNKNLVLAEDYRAATPASNSICTLNTPPVSLAVDDMISGYLSQSSGGNLSTDDPSGWPYLQVIWLPQ